MLMVKIKLIKEIGKIIKYEAEIEGLGNVVIDSVIPNLEGQRVYIKMAAMVEPGIHQTKWVIVDTKSTLISKIERSKLRLDSKSNGLKALGVYNQMVDRLKQLQKRLQKLLEAEA